MTTLRTAPHLHRGNRPADGRSDLAAVMDDCAEVIRHARAALEAHALVVQCAWCSRYLLGAQLVAEADLPCHLGAERLRRDRRVTHGVCDDCITELVQAPA